MGLQSQLTDVSSDSLPILLLVLIATAVTHLRHLISSVYFPSSSSHSISYVTTHDVTPSDDAAVIAAVCTSYRYTHDVTSTSSDDDDVDCVFCLCNLKDGDYVRRLSCCHVFHRECLDGWIDQMKFNCPLCRSPLVPNWRRVDQPWRRVDETGRRVDQPWRRMDETGRRVELLTAQ